MFKKTTLIALATASVLNTGAQAAPLFPDVSANHWATSAVQRLAAKGLVKGYQDGTFLGDRAATRYEVAMMISRVLSEYERNSGAFGESELDELAQLVESFGPELEALGVRVDELDTQVGSFDGRLQELEKIHFYGDFETRINFMSFNNEGLPTNGLLNYDTAVGSVIGAGASIPGGIPFNPFVTGSLPVISWVSGRPLVNGTGLSAVATLGLTYNLSSDWLMGAEFKGYSSQGNSVIDAYYGAQQPYLSNPWTSTSVLSGPDQANTPYTRFTLDRVWVEHASSRTRVNFGAFDSQDFSDSVFAGFYNPNEYGPERLDNYGVLIEGEIPFNEFETSGLTWEAMFTVLPNGNVPLNPADTRDYYSHAEGLNLAWHFSDSRGLLKANYLRASDEANNGSSLPVGLYQRANLLLNWVNPQEYSVGVIGPAVATGFGTGGDIRPVPLAAPVDVLLVPGFPKVGGIGPQGQDTFSLEGSYEFDWSFRPTIYGMYAHSEYSPSKNSDYSVGGDAIQAGLTGSFFNSALDLGVEYINVDPYFSPFIVPTPNVGGITTPLWHSPDFDYQNNLYSLHNTKELPHNRAGFRIDGTWKFAPTGRISVGYANFDQVDASVPTVNYAGVGGQVTGFKPGWMDPLFGMLQGGETEKGSATHWNVSGGYKWLFDEAESNRGLLFSGGFKNRSFQRDSASPNPIVRDINLVDLGFTGWHVQMDYDFSEKFTGWLGYSNVDIAGHLDPLGVNAPHAALVGNGGFDNIDITQTIPELGFSWEVQDNIDWLVNAKFYSLTDNVDPSVTNRVSLPNLNFIGPSLPGHPFDWEGVHVTTQFTVKF